MTNLLNGSGMIRYDLPLNSNVCGNSMPWCAWDRWGGDIFSWLFVLILSTNLTLFNNIGDIFADAQPKYAHSGSENCLSFAQV